MRADFGRDYGGGDFGQSIDLSSILKTAAGSAGASLLSQFMSTSAGSELKEQLVAQTEEKAVVTGWQTVKEHMTKHWHLYAIGGGVLTLAALLTVYKAWFSKR